jgi:hypothetical protein
LRYVLLRHRARVQAVWPACSSLFRQAGSNLSCGLTASVELCATGSATDRRLRDATMPLHMVHTVRVCVLIVWHQARCCSAWIWRPVGLPPSLLRPQHDAGRALQARARRCWRARLRVRRVCHSTTPLAPSSKRYVLTLPPSHVCASPWCFPVSVILVQQAITMRKQSARIARGVVGWARLMGTWNTSTPKASCYRVQVIEGPMSRAPRATPRQATAAQVDVHAAAYDASTSTRGSCVGARVHERGRTAHAYHVHARQSRRAEVYVQAWQ